MTSTAAVVAGLLVIAAVASVVILASSQQARAGPPGPISTYPASWTSYCGRPGFLGFSMPVFGDKTTTNDIASGLFQPLPNETLGRIYSAIVNSTQFKTESAGHSWVTIYWGLQEGRGSAGAYREVVGQFLLLSGGKPYTVIQAEYDIDTFAVGAQVIGFVCG
jgi:hypothetical protein